MNRNFPWFVAAFFFLIALVVLVTPNDPLPTPPIIDAEEFAVMVEEAFPAADYEVLGDGVGGMYEGGFYAMYTAVVKPLTDKSGRLASDVIVGPMERVGEQLPDDDKQISSASHTSSWRQVGQIRSDKRFIVISADIGDSGRIEFCYMESRR